MKRRDIRKGYRGNQSWNQQHIITITIIYLSSSSPPQEASQTSLNMKTISFFAALSLSPFIPSLAAPLSETESLPSFEGQVDALQLGTLSTRNDLVDNSPCKAVTHLRAWHHRSRQRRLPRRPTLLLRPLVRHRFHKSRRPGR